MIIQAVPEPAEWVQLVSNLLALDQASRVTGWAFFKDNKLEAFGHFTTHGDDEGAKLNEIRAKVIELIQKYDIDEAAYENIQLQANVGNNVQTFKVLAEVYGVITELFYSNQIPARSYLATSWKSTIGVKGRTRADQKRAAQALVLDKYKVQCTQDEADAICIGASVCKLNETEKTPFDWS